MLTEENRSELLGKISDGVAKSFSDVHLKWIDWPGALDRHREAIVSSASDEAFELAVKNLLEELKSSHVGFYHEDLKRSSAKMAICATYTPHVLPGGERWIFQDVHEGGPAAMAGIRPGDILLSVEGRLFQPPEHPSFPVGETVTVTVLTKGDEEKSCSVVIPSVKQKMNQLPQVLPKPLVSHKRINHEIGYIRIAAYPGVIGTDVANDMLRAVESLNPIHRLIVDLRGNSGGGGAFLRLLSLFTPERLTVGSFSRRGFVRGSANGDQSFVFDRIPTNRLGRYLMILRFGTQWLTQKALGRDVSVTVVTEGRGQQPFHGRVVLLVNRHTSSANQMVVAAARESNLAVTVGENMPGRLLEGTELKVGYGYRLVVPQRAFQSTGNDRVEGRLIEPDFPAEFDYEQVQLGFDNQLQKAIEVVSQL
jgi:carboxyl-terminal processing protease